MERVAHAAVGAELLEEGDVGRGRERAGAARAVRVRRVRAGVAEPPEAEELRADEDDVIVGEAGGLGNEHPRPVAGAEVADDELPLAPREHRVHRGEVEVALDADVARTPANGGVRLLEGDHAFGLAALVEEGDARRLVSKTRREHLRGLRARLRRTAGGAEEIHAAPDAGAAGGARRDGDVIPLAAAPAVGAERECGIDGVAAPLAGDGRRLTRRRAV